MKILNLLSISFLLLSSSNYAADIHTWEMYEIVLKADLEYENYYTDVTCWLDLEGPDFSKHIYGFWNGENTYIIRVVATKPGLWKWETGSNQTADNGLNNHSG